MNEVIVTGCFGFIGCNLVKKLSKEGYVVYGIGRGRGDNIGDKFINADISFSNLDLLFSTMKKAPKIIYHLAGGSSVGTAVSEPYGDFCKGVNASAVLIEWVRINCPQTKVIVASSAAVYGCHSGGPLSENSQIKPFSNYGYHKEMIERLAAMYVNNHSLNITVVRIFSVYGEGLKKQLLWDTCNRLKNMDKPSHLVCFGTGYEERDWIHINDVCMGLYELISSDDTMPFAINMGTGVANTVSNLISLLCKYWFNTDESNVNISFNQESRVGDPFSLVAGCEIKDAFCSKPTTTLEVGVLNYVRWYKNNYV